MLSDIHKQKIQVKYNELNKSFENQLIDLMENRKVMKDIIFQTQTEKNKVIYRLDPIDIHKDSKLSKDHAIEEIFHLAEIINEKYVRDFIHHWDELDIQCTIHPLIELIEIYKRGSHDDSDFYDKIVQLIQAEDEIVISQLEFKYDREIKKEMFVSPIRELNLNDFMNRDTIEDVDDLKNSEITSQQISRHLANIFAK